MTELDAIIRQERLSDNDLVLLREAVQHHPGWWQAWTAIMCEQDKRIDRLRADLAHARQWGNLYHNLYGTRVSGDRVTEASIAAWRFCFDDATKESKNVTASDGWKVGDPA